MVVAVRERYLDVGDAKFGVSRADNNRDFLLNLFSTCWNVKTLAVHTKQPFEITHGGKCATMKSAFGSKRRARKIEVDEDEDGGANTTPNTTAEQVKARKYTHEDRHL